MIFPEATVYRGSPFDAALAALMLSEAWKQQDADVLVLAEAKILQMVKELDEKLFHAHSPASSSYVATEAKSELEEVADCGCALM